MKMVTQQEHTVAVDRRNLCIVDQCSLPLQVFILRMLCLCLQQGCMDPFAHFRCRRTRKGHNEQPVDIDRILARDPGQDALYQNCRLTASRRSRYQYIFISRLDDLLLILRKLHVPSPPFFLHL